MQSVPKRKASPEADDDEPTEVKLALLASLHPDSEQEALLDALLAHQGSVSRAAAALQTAARPGTNRDKSRVGHQQSLRHYALAGASTAKRVKAKKGSTLHLYDPEDVAEHTPCTIIHNFLPAHDADELLRELLREAETFEKITFKLFDNVVASLHTSAFFVESYDAMRSQKDEYFYNGSKLTVGGARRPRLLAAAAADQGTRFRMCGASRPSWPR